MIIRGMVPVHPRFPIINNFTSKAEYYAAMFHELSHNTGHATRLNRETLAQPAFYASETYCMEELIAEIAACFICHEAGIVDKTIRQSTTLRPISGSGRIRSRRS
jgi:antirestriction protein ArdC